MKQSIYYFQGKNTQSKNNESGRTMLEMLGVLGIMGIIMYGAVAGINYGMSTYKINQTYNEVQEAIQGIQDMYSWSRNIPRTISTSLDKLCENDIFVRCNDNSPVNTFGGDINVKAIQVSGAIVDDSCSTDCNSFYISYADVDQDVCNRLLEMDWGTVLMDSSCNSETNTIYFCPRSTDQTKCTN